MDWTVCSGNGLVQLCLIWKRCCLPHTVQWYCTTDQRSTCVMQSNPDVRSWMSSNGLDNLSQLEEYFERRVLDLATLAGRSYIVWQVWVAVYKLVPVSVMHGLCTVSSSGFYHLTWKVQLHFWRFMCEDCLTATAWSSNASKHNNSVVENFNIEYPCDVPEKSKPEA